ncbi:MAG: DNA repair protein RecO [Candidatus Moraniibacteriota bacterium]
MEYKYTGIVLNKKDIRETDRIYNIYTLEQGKISAMARGVRKSKSKLAGHLENYCYIDLTVMKNRGMGNISSSIVENNFKNLRNDYYSLNKVLRSTKLLMRLLNDQEKDNEVFYLYLDFLESLDKISLSEDEVMKDLLTQGFIFKLLDNMGYKLEINKCVGCGENLAAQNNFFDYSEGGILCKRCASEAKNIVPISIEAIKIIRIFFQNKICHLSKLKINVRQARELDRLSQVFTKWIC